VQALATTLLLIGCGGFRESSAGTNVLIFNNVSTSDDSVASIQSVTPSSASPPIRISFDYMKGQKINPSEHHVPILFSTPSMLSIVPPHDSIGMYSATEPQSSSSYATAALQRGNEFSAEAGPKYSISGALPPGLLLFGESLIYGLTGITDFEESTKSFTSRSGCASDM
jgi:NADH-quinone oxidoreductase subunit N